ncbi:hypothetical protein CAOG_000543 [Capsaspora owczarzaki ATCC 30864]|uniref:Nuclear pore complex protein Nup85 n=1 Tax=Capsaspora owczarzaki (strain ATCC 30864) TaxID=595528 RepID=A0A0D2X0F7_CAPO3|nr:hypothetical protein CAOG_000543 [Capsaspora owczarzaki ATCC 30864]
MIQDLDLKYSTRRHKCILLPRFSAAGELSLTPVAVTPKHNAQARQQQQQQQQQQLDAGSAAPSQHDFPHAIVSLALHPSPGDDYIRQLVSEFHTIFCDVQKAVKAAAAKTALAPVTTASRRLSQFSNTQSALSSETSAILSKRYRQALKATELNLLHDLQRTAIVAGHADAQAALENHHPVCQEMFQTRQVIVSSMTLWHLCEIMFIDTRANGLVTDSLCAWLQHSFDASVERLPDEFIPASAANRSVEELQLWAYIARLVMRGDTDSAQQLLPQPNESPSAAVCFGPMNALLANVPRGSAATSVSEFMLAWSRWREECRIQQRDVFAGHFGWELLGRVLLGDQAVLRKLAQQWYELVVARLFLVTPNTKVFDLGLLAQEAMAELPPPLPISPDQAEADTGAGEFDRIMAAAFEFDIQKVVQDCTTLFDGWFVAHFTDLLQRCGKLESIPLAYGSDIREFFVLEYANQLASHNALWRLACDYFASCSVFGPHFLKAFVERVAPFSSEKKAAKLMLTCDRFGLTEERSTIHKVLGKWRLQQGRLGAALGHFIQTRDVTHVTAISLQLLDSYRQTGVLPDLAVLDAFGTEVGMSKALTILHKYKQFHSLYRSGDLREAARLLVDLLAHESAPKRMWFTLLLDALPLLESEQLLFGVSQTYILMRSVEELCEAHNLTSLLALDLKADGKSSSSSSSSSSAASAAGGARRQINEQMEVVRLALARNLSRALVLKQQ